tara:strand:- start:726 stop:2525 length:1800 start_codon:yes stop_codon:yes gene_type:complete
MPKKKVAVSYTSRDFVSIKNELVQYAKRYYPDTFRDFNEAGFGSLLLDTVAYVGDMLSFYVDYQANESFLSTALEYDNIIKLSKQLGFKLDLAPSSVGVASFYIVVPANSIGTGPDTSYLPVLEKGSEFMTTDGRGFILNEDVNFANTRFVAGKVSARQDPDTGNTTYFAIKAYGQVMSGQLIRETAQVGAFEKFKRVRISGNNITEIISVTDSDGNEYHEVEYLSQDVVYKALKNRGTNADSVQSLLTAVPVPRRFTVERQRAQVYLQFGFGSDSELTTKSIADPSNVVLEVHGKDYFSDKTLDPNNLIATDKLGVGPSNTTLTVVYRVNNSSDMNVAPTGLDTVASPSFRFPNFANLSSNAAAAVINSLEVSNEDSIVGSISYPTSEELKHRAFSHFATQNRAVTKQDYISMIYNMPPDLGAIKRCNIVQDKDSFKRNLNLYVISEDSSEKLVETNSTIKQNLKNWLASVKMVNDTIDILDARLVNLGIEFVAIADVEANRFDVLKDVQDALAEHFEILPNIAQPFYISDVYNVINDVEGIVDVVTVDITKKEGSNYSTVSFTIEDYQSADGRYITLPENFIWEIKYPDSDIKGTLK